MLWLLILFLLFLFLLLWRFSFSQNIFRASIAEMPWVLSNMQDRKGLIAMIKFHITIINTLWRVGETCTDPTFIAFGFVRVVTSSYELCCSTIIYGDACLHSSAKQLGEIKIPDIHI